MCMFVCRVCVCGGMHGEKTSKGLPASSGGGGGGGGRTRDVVLVAAEVLRLGLGLEAAVAMHDDLPDDLHGEKERGFHSAAMQVHAALCPDCLDLALASSCCMAYECASLRLPDALRAV